MKKYKIIYQSVFFLFTVLTFSSCATVLRGKDGNPSKRVVDITGSPEEASVYLNGNLIGETPLHYKFDKLKEGNEISIKKEGYETAYVQIERKANPIWVPVSIIGNIPLFILPALIDFSNGSVYDIKEQDIKFNLKQINQK